MSRFSSVSAAGFLTLVLLGTALASAEDIAALTAPLLAAHERGAVGSIEGRAYAEGRRGGAEATPYASVSVLLVPRSAEFETKLQAIKAGSRESIDAYFEAEPKVSEARLALERSLIDTGAGLLILGESSDGTGTFRFLRVPEGNWTLLAWREVAHAKRPTLPSRIDAQRYKNRPQVFGYTDVVFWWMPITVQAGEAATVRLHDRNEWFTGVREDRRVPDPAKATIPSMQQGAAPR